MIMKRSVSFIQNTVLAGAAFVTALVGGCEPVRPVLFDEVALTVMKTVTILPFSDAPGPDAIGSGRSVRGVIVTELLRLPELNIQNLSPEKVSAALNAAGYIAEDCFDPVVAADVARRLNVDAVVVGELLHFGLEKQHVTTSAMFVTGGETKTNHWVSLNLRIVRAADAKIIYVGSGTAQSRDGYTPAAGKACKKCLASVKYFLEQKRKE
ncbi:MAG TPA: hypothetical protein ENH84_03965 [Phycisphaerae bacterium]|nr:hypothetical protein [Phycisphaerae bacterium]